MGVTEATEIDQVERVEQTPSNPEYVEFAPVEEERLSASAVITVIAIVFVYMAQMLHINGSGFLGHTITADIGGQDKTTWITIIFALYPTIAGPPISQLADFWGRKWLVIVTAWISVVGCIVLGCSTSIGMALGSSVVAGASAGCQSILHAVPSEVLPRKYRPYAQTAVAIAAAVGAVFGLYAAGAMVENNPSGWRSYFYMLAGTYFLGGLLVLIFYQPRLRQEQKLSFAEKVHALDLPAMSLIVFALTTLCVGLGYSNNPYAWTNARVLAPLLVGAVSALVLGWYAVSREKHGLFDHDLYQTRNFAIAQAGVFVESLSFIAVANYFGFQVSLVYGQTLFRSGLIYSIVYYASIVGTILTGVYSSRSKKIRPPAVLAFVCFTIYFILMVTTSPSTPLANLWGYNVFIGFGLTLSLNPLVVAAQLSTPPRLISTATGLLIATRALGSSVGLAVFNAIFNSAISDKLVPSILAAIAPLGLPQSSYKSFIDALITGNKELLSKIPGLTPEISEAGYGGMLKGYTAAFRDVYICGAAFSAATVLIVCFLQNPKDQFTAHVDAPVKEIQILSHGPIERLDTVSKGA